LRMPRRTVALGIATTVIRNSMSQIVRKRIYSTGRILNSSERWPYAICRWSRGSKEAMMKAKVSRLG
jgi:hypothetical protein